MRPAYIVSGPCSQHRCLKFPGLWCTPSPYHYEATCSEFLITSQYLHFLNPFSGCLELNCVPLKSLCWCSNPSALECGGFRGRTLLSCKETRLGNRDGLYYDQTFGIVWSNQLPIKLIKPEFPRVLHLLRRLPPESAVTVAHSCVPFMEGGQIFFYTQPDAAPVGSLEPQSIW